MSKLNSKKMLTVLITLAMIFSALAVISMAAEPAYAATITSPIYDPTVFTAGVQTTTAVIGGSGFTSGGVVNFYLGTTTTYSSSDPLIGTARLPAGATSFASAPGQAVNLTIPSGTAAGTYYILSEDVATSAFAASTAVTVTTLTPTITIAPTSQTAGGLLLVTGSGWESGATLTFYLGIPGSTPLTVYPSSTTVTVSGTGVIPAKTYLEVPTTSPSGVYAVIAQESTGTLYTGITADATFTLQPAIGTGSSPSPSAGAVTSISGALSSSFYIEGYGFPAGATVSGTASGAVTVGGVSAVLAASGTVSTTGQISLQVTSIVSKISTSGPQTIVITTSKGTFSFPASIYVSVPGVSTTLSVTDIYTGTNSGVAGDPLEIVGYGFLAGSSVTVTFDGTTFTGITADGNGFFLSYDVYMVPYVQAGTYSVFAETGGVFASTTFTVQAEVSITDSAGNNLNGEYAASSLSVVTVTVQGYAPFQMYNINDTGAYTYFGTGNIALLDYYGDLTVKVTKGTFDKQVPAFVADGTGTLELSYHITYYGLSTGTSESITVESVPSMSSVGSANYLAIGYAVTTLSTSYSPSQTVTLSFTGLVPYGAAATPESAGSISPYSVYVEPTSSTSAVHYYLASTGHVTFTNTKTTFVSSSSGTATVSFVAPSSASIYTLTVYGGSTSSGVTYGVSRPVFNNNEFIVSVAGTSGATVYVNPAVTSTISGTGASGSPFLMYPDPNAYEYDVKFDLYDFPANTAVTVTYYTATGPNTATVTTDSTGAATYKFAPPNTIGSVSFLLEFSVNGLSIAGGAVTGTVPGAAAYLYELEPAASYIPSPFLDNSGSPVTDYESYFGVPANSGSNVTAYLNSLSPNTAYTVYLTTSSASPVPLAAGINLGSFTTNSDGNLNLTVLIPVLTSSGTYYLDFVQSSTVTTSFAYSQQLTLEVQQAIYAFPGEISTFSVIPAATGFMPGAPGTAYYNGVTGGEYSYGQIYVTVLLNGTSYTTSPAAYGTVAGTIYLNGSFLAPNAAPGTWWYVTFLWSQTVTVVYLAGGSPTSTTTAGSAYQNSGTVVSEPALLDIVQGNGALLTGISSSEIATIEAQLSSTITTTLQVPISELSANITALHGDIVQITTAFGTMTTTLQAINATVASISSGQALVLTDLGSIKTSLASLNASIAAFNGNIVTINTTLGQVETTLAGINTQVTTNGNGIATIKTDLGTLTGVVTATNGTVSTIKTSLGNLTTTVGKINTNTQGFSTLEIFLIVAIVLILITLVIAFLAVSNTNKLSKKFEEQKKQ